MNQKRYEGYLIDLDGTLYRGIEVIPGAVHFMKRLVEQNIPYLYLTNNSSRLPEQVAKYLRSFGLPATPEQVYTSAMATAQYVQKNHPESKVFVVGEEGLRHALKEVGMTVVDHEPDVVVAGIDRSFDYEKCKRASLAIQAGAAYIATNVDRVLPTEEGYLPGSGTINIAISHASNTKPVVIGKPETIILQYALELLGIKADETLIVGDNLETDILTGVRGGVDTLMVTTGVHTRLDVEKYNITPTFVVDHLDKWEI
ncbi:TIGR01457 family HAD-type hydrolase [Thermoactinomyces sp. DSM 45892]|uniref:TIGR01457 family HAD-type hydrolase n=1 Tax=Thermoactinomyces sp. DSM 45892 TaxID=1882753 RepID=UPI00089B36C7|nr:TIGR01457 family HAD-type hydrolase [Thermoactinomyces sp. DSM 45892]SDZ37113.1 4-nitrophenyl phosphatase [Thermoactinomyces sp. DSM 45892]